MKLLKKLLWLLFICILAVGLIAFGYYLAVTHSVNLQPDKLLLSNKQIIIYDGQNELVKNAVFSNKKHTVTLTDIPKSTQDAFVSVEDKRFYEHHGFDLKRILGASLHNLQAHSLKEGASTISQQLIKNTHLSQEKTFKRKLREWKLTRQLERKYSKADILEKYLNSIYFGHDCFGIGAASAFYFDKMPSELTLPESALLAGLVKSPNNYSPFRNPKLCLKRRNTVLSLMKKAGKINNSDYTAAQNAPLPQQQGRKMKNGYLDFVFEELSELSERLQFSVGGKIEISTYLDQALQEEVENAALEITDCEKQILVLDQAAKGYKAAYSNVGRIARSPGSIIKPLLVYAPAIEENLLSPSTPILDEKVDYGEYSPENYAGKYHGYVSARECVAQSLNVPAVKTLSALGVNKGASYLEKLGLNVPKEDFSLALALGGMKNGFTLQELTEAYSVFPSGEKSSCGFISEIKINGVRVYKASRQNRRVFSKESAFLMTDILKTAAKIGTAKKLRNFPFDIAAKTGTVGTKNGNTDAYTLSFTTKDVVGVWLGNKDNAFIAHMGGGTPCSLSQRIHDFLYQQYKENGLSIPYFSKPDEVVCVTLDKLSYEQNHTLLLADDIAPPFCTFEEYFKKSNVPKSQSKTFSHPFIPLPKTVLEHGKLKIIFDQNSPDFYEYKIDKYDYAKHTTVYFGDYVEYFIDVDLEPNKKYLYTITPIYKNHVGKKIVLPVINTQSAKKEESITQKEWWEY